MVSDMTLRTGCLSNNLHVFIAKVQYSNTDKKGLIVSFIKQKFYVPLQKIESQWERQESTDKYTQVSIPK